MASTHLFRPSTMTLCEPLILENAGKINLPCGQLTSMELSSSIHGPSVWLSSLRPPRRSPSLPTRGALRRPPRIPRGRWFLEAWEDVAETIRAVDEAHRPGGPDR